jgi:hypothetical protein
LRTKRSSQLSYTPEGGLTLAPRTGGSAIEPRDFP